MKLIQKRIISIPIQACPYSECDHISDFPKVVQITQKITDQYKNAGMSKAIKINKYELSQLLTTALSQLTNNNLGKKAKKVNTKHRK